MTDRIEVVGDTRLVATLKAAARRVSDMRPPGLEAGTFVATRGRSDAPHRTGRLASSIRSAATRTDVEVTSALPYANRVHWGYRRYYQAAQPFLADAVNNNQPTIVNKYADRVDQILHGVKGA